MIRLDGQVALITGGASGIGAAVARRFTERGARVVIADVDPAGADIAAALDGVFVRTDVTRLSDNLDAVATAVDRYGRLDIAVLNAGIGEQGGFVDDFRPDHYRDLIAVNLDGVVYGVHAALGVFTERRSGAIIATASLSGLTESPFTPLYAATKHGVVGLVRSVAPAVSDRGVTLNALCPTFIDTPILGEAVPYLSSLGVAVLEPERVADAAEAILAGGGTGEAWTVVPHDAPSPFEFPAVPALTIEPADQPSEATS